MSRAQALRGGVTLERSHSAIEQPSMLRVFVEVFPEAERSVKGILERGSVLFDWVAVARGAKEIRHHVHRPVKPYICVKWS